MPKPCLLRAMLLCIAMLAIFSSQAQEPSDAELKKILTANAARLPVSAGDIADALINSTYLDKSAGIRYIYLQQGYRSIGVFNQVIAIALRNGQVLHVSGRFIPALASRVPASVPVIVSGDAIQRTAKHLQLSLSGTPKIRTNTFATDNKLTFEPLNIAKHDIETKLVWVQDDLDSLKIRLAWNVSIDVLGSEDWWNVRIDALTGEYVNKNNFTVHETTTAPDDKNNNTPWNPPSSFMPPGYKPAAIAAPRAPAAFLQTPVTGSSTYRVLPFP
jgi:extracellular elastinolytic metalloproteinase